MKKIISILLSMSLVCCLSACSTPPKSEQLQVTGVYFDTVVQIQAWGTDLTVLNECKELCKTYENKFSSHIADSEISKINRANGQPVTVSDETIELLKTGIEYSKLSDGAFDITIASVSELWDFTENKNGTLPDQTAIKEAVTHVNYENILIEGNTVTMMDPKSKLDLGGIAKGYIADRLKEYLIAEGVEHALINLGGNILAVGSRYDGSSFEIGIQKPFDETGNALTSVNADDRSVVSSGIYQRYFEHDGQIYHHILDPKTGYPYENNLLQVTILSESSAAGDALSTTCFALGLEKGSELIENLDGVGAIFVTDDYELHYAGDL